MGSDLYMAQRNWMPRPSKVTWVSETEIEVKHDRFMGEGDGYVTAYRGKATPEVRQMLKGMGLKVPKNDFTLPETQIRFFEVKQPEDGFRYKIIGRFWNEKDANEFAAKNPGIHDFASQVDPVTIKIKGVKS